jgi:hypothetical protein
MYTTACHPGIPRPTAALQYVRHQSLYKQLLRNKLKPLIPIRVHETVRQFGLLQFT